MPTKVKAHWTHTKKGKRVRVRGFIRNGPEHTARWRAEVAAIVRSERRTGRRGNPYAIATARLGRRGTFPRGGGYY